MLRPSTRVIISLLTMLALAGCSSLAQPRTGMWSTHESGDAVSGYELTASGASSLYDALVRTRGGYFSARGISSLVNAPSEAILVFRAGMLMGDVNVLRMLRPTDVRVVRRLNATDTFHKYGRNVSVGGLEIELVNE
jgi:hypothetical protein